MDFRFKVSSWCFLYGFPGRRPLAIRTARWSTSCQCLSGFLGLVWWGKLFGRVVGWLVGWLVWFGWVGFGWVVFFFFCVVGFGGVSRLVGWVFWWGGWLVGWVVGWFGVERGVIFFQKIQAGGGFEL